MAQRLVYVPPWALYIGGLVVFVALVTSIAAVGVGVLWCRLRRRQAMLEEAAVIGAQLPMLVLTVTKY